MVTATFFSPIHMNFFHWFYALPTSVSDLTDTGILMGGSAGKYSYSTVLGGTLDYGYFVPDGGTTPGEKLGVVAGTWHSYDLYFSQVLQQSISGINFDIHTALIYMQQMDFTGDKSYDKELTSIIFSGDDNIQGSPFNDLLKGFAGSDVIYGGAHKDTLMGGTGGDTLDGGAGRDKLFGGRGTDFLAGGDGSDVLAGQQGHDTLEGGAGSDTFNFAKFGQARGDVINDFNQSQHDHINFSHVGGLSFGGVGDLTGVAGEIRYEHVGGNTLVHIDIDGDGQSDALLTLIGNINLHASDFIL